MTIDPLPQPTGQAAVHITNTSITNMTGIVNTITNIMFPYYY